MDPNSQFKLISNLFHLDFFRVSFFHIVTQQPGSKRLLLLYRAAYLKKLDPIMSVMVILLNYLFQQEIT